MNDRRVTIGRLFQPAGRPLATLCLAFVVVLIPAARMARAEDKASCELLEIHATTGEKPSVPAELKRLEKKLKKPPFSSWNTFALLSQASKELTALRAESVRLKKGAASLLLREIQRGSKRARLSLAVTIDDQGGKRVLDTKVMVDAGDFVLFGRSLPKNEGLVLAVSCR